MVRMAEWDRLFARIPLPGGVVRIRNQLKKRSATTCNHYQSKDDADPGCCIRSRFENL